jgi:hypothetical protein
MNSVARVEATISNGEYGILITSRGNDRESAKWLTTHCP